MGFVAFPADYRAYVIKQAGSSGSPINASVGAGFPVTFPKNQNTLTWSLQTLKAAQVQLTTTGVGQATLTFYDPGQYLLEQVQPHAMCGVQLRLANRFGTWAPCFTGYVDAAHHIFDPAQGDLLELVCTSPYKLFEITRQTPGDVSNLAVAYLTNVSGSTVLKYAANACNFPLGMLQIDANADAGSGLWSNIATSVFIDPQQQTWSAVLSALLANSGLEMFTDESGVLHWRPLGYLGPTPMVAGLGLPAVTPRPVLEEEILYADLAESDQSVVTSIEVRWGPVPTTQLAGRWTAPAGMTEQLFGRSLVVYAPWILSQNAAQYLATSLGQMYAANILVGSVTIPADPTFGVGTLVQIPSLRSTSGTTYYYITSVQYQLEWGGAWTMTLGLAYGRSPDQSFPYVGSIAQPVATPAILKDFPNQNQILLGYSATNPVQITNTFTVQANQTLKPSVIQVDPALGLPAGSVVFLTTSLAGGTSIGPSLNGEYTVQNGPAGSGFTVYIKSTDNSTGTGYLTIRAGAPAPSTATSGPSQSQQVLGFSAAAPGAGTADNGTGQGNVPASGQDTTPPATGTLAIRALNAAMTLKGKPYGRGQAGPTSWDCSGLVVWAYVSVGYTPPQFLPYGGPYNANAIGPHRGPSLLYSWFLQNGAKSIPVDQAQPGDLLFIKEPGLVGDYPDGQSGFSHCAFCQTAGGFATGTDFGANSPKAGIGTTNIGGFLSFFGTPFNLALDMSGVTLNNQS